MEWLISVFLEEFVLTCKGNILKKYSDKKKFKKALESMFTEFKKKYEFETFYNDLDGFFSVNKLVQKLVKNCIGMWKEKLPFSDKVYDIADKFIDEFPKYSPYRTRICKGLQDIFGFCFDKINGEIENEDLQKATNQILLDNNRNQDKITNSVKQIKDLLERKEETTFGNELSIQIKKKDIDFSVISRCMNGSERENEVTYILKKLKEKTWVHILGEIWSGKTQFLKLISDRVYSYKYIDLDKINMNYGIEDIYMDMAVCSDCDGGSKESIVDAFLNKHLLDGVLFIDGIHEEILGDKLVELISLFSTKCREKGVKFITCGYTDITTVLKVQCDVSDVLVYNLPKLSQPEVIEIMFKNGMPENVVDVRIARFLSEAFGNVPALVMELIYELKERDWNTDDSYYNDLIMAKADGVEKQLEHIIFSRIEDENVRVLLYRLAGVEHDIPVKVLPEIGKISPEIMQLDRARYSITSRWGNEKDDMILIPRIFRRVANKHLTKHEKEEIHLILIEYYKEKKVLNEVEICNLIAHLMDLQLYDEVGQLYVNVLASMMDEGIKNDIWRFALFWETTALPEGMSLPVQTVVRLEQIRYLAFADMDYTYQFNDLLTIIDKEQECGQFLLIIMALLKNDDFSSHSKCMEKSLQLNLWGETQEEVEKYLDSLEGIEWSRFEISFFDFFILKYCLTIHNVQELEIFLAQLKKVSPVQIGKVIDSQEKVLLTLFERIRMGLKDEDISKYGKIIEEWRNWTRDNNLCKLYLQMGIPYLRYLFGTRKEYDAAIQFFGMEKAKYNLELEQHEFVDAMAKLLYECKETDTDIKLIEESYLSLPEKSDSVFDDVYTCLLFMEFADMEYNSQAAEKMLNYAMQPDEVHVEFAIEAKAKAEYFINAYFCNQLGSKILDFSKYIMEVIENKDMPQRKVLLTLLLKDIVYIIGDIIYNDPPLLMPDGEKYAEPERNRYWIITNEKGIEGLYSEEKDIALMLVTAELLDFYKHKYEANKICNKLFETKDIETTMLASFLVTDSYLLLKLIEHDKWELLTEFILSLDSDHGSNEEDISVPIKTLLIVSAYLANLSRKGNFSDINIDKIVLLGTLNIRQSWRIYFEEYCKVIKVFVTEEGDEDILLACAEKVKGTSLDMLRAVIYTLMYPRTSEITKRKIKDILKILNVNLKMENDYFYKQLIK